MCVLLPKRRKRTTWTTIRLKYYLNDAHCLRGAIFKQDFYTRSFLCCTSYVLTYGRDTLQYHNNTYGLMVKKPCLLVRKYSFSIVIWDIFKIWALISNFTNRTARTQRSPYVFSRKAANCLNITEPSVYSLLYFFKSIGWLPQHICLHQGPVGRSGCRTDGQATCGNPQAIHW
jgi:hypothetical protein